MGRIKVDLTGKVALITGASTGIGSSIALSMAESGARIIAVSRTKDKLSEVKQKIETTGGISYPIPCDVRNVSDITDMVSKAFELEPRIDILVNSAGVNILAHTLEVTEEQWDTIMDTNLKGLFFTSQAVAKRMKAFGEGSIINITSQMALVGFYKRVAYCASKGGVTQATKAMAVELAEHNIRVNCVAPTYIKTPMTGPMFEDKQFYDEVIRRIPLGRIGEVSDVSDAVLYLASDSANMVTGSTVLVDGGWVAW